ncbi:MAG TPA: 6-hydroxycyclohex-1-ene-1-carbonyl-CoA dehydrogenase [Candidatus Polarisedimenticolia bacterium]|nr:6-hydroxycyclohex-1-ene-1-carbonyl-CoA dehydrogenase [Candidatus Polarisedimenticolia bacterium]
MTSVRGAYGFQLQAPKTPLQPCELSTLDPGPGEVVVQVAGCGVCHTDIGFAYDGVPTRHPLPLILGHEISGRVVAAGANAGVWLKRSVVVPAVIPCGSCPACRAGRATICRQQFMPGNDGDGGFATHVLVPSRGLCAVPEPLPSGVTLEMLSVVADAVTTPYEAMRRAELGPNDVAVIVGAGGVGGFGVQIAAALGAAVVAIDIDRERLDLAAKHGAGLVLDSGSTDLKGLRSAVRAFAKESGRTGIGLKIFEMSGTPGGQATAFGLLDFGAYLAVVGFTPKPVELRLSNLMAFDATARGNWGCPPDQYPGALQMVLAGKIALAPYIELHALEETPAVVEAVAKHSIRRRAILQPKQSH